MRCMGENMTAGGKGSPSRTITVRSSNEANSAPLKLSPSAARARIIPQNFSRGLHNVAITTAPGENGSFRCARLTGAPGELFGMPRLSPGQARIANRASYAAEFEQFEILRLPRNSGMLSEHAARHHNSGHRISRRLLLRGGRANPAWLEFAGRSQRTSCAAGPQRFGKNDHA